MPWQITPLRKKQQKTKQNNSITNKQTNKNKKPQTNQKPQLIGLHRIVKHIVFQYLICLNKFIILLPILVFIPSYFMVYNHITESRTGNQVYCVLVAVSYWLFALPQTLSALADMVYQTVLILGCDPDWGNNAISIECAAMSHSLSPYLHM